MAGRVSAGRVLNSINTNKLALLAAQAMNGANTALAAAQKRVSTGLSVAGAKDNAAVWGISESMQAQGGGWRVANESLSRGQSLIAVASAGLDTITDLLRQAREKAVALSDPSLSAESKTFLRADLQSLVRQIDKTAQLAEFDGKKPLADNLMPTTTTTTTTTYNNPGPSAQTPASMAGLINYTSGAGSRTFAVDGGATAGRVDIYLDLYSATDVVEAWQGGQRVAATGQPYVAGGGSVGPGAPSTYQNVLSFDYDPTNGHALEFRFNESYGGSGWRIDNVTLTSPPGPLPTPTTTTTTTPTTTSVATTYEFVRTSNGDLEGVGSRPMTAEALKLDKIDWNDPGPLVASIDAAMSQALDAAGYFGERGRTFDRLVEQNGRLSDTLATGIGNLIDADMGREAARLQAAKVKTQLAAKTLGIAAAQPNWLTNLFKR